MATSSSVPTATKSRFISVTEYPDGEGTKAAIAAEMQATGMVVMRFPTPVTDTMKQEMAMATEVLLRFNWQENEEYFQHVVTELMKLYNAGVKICVVEFPKSFPLDALVNLGEALDKTLPQLMTEKDESGTGRLRRLKVYFMMEV